MPAFHGASAVPLTCSRAASCGRSTREHPAQSAHWEGAVPTGGTPIAKPNGVESRNMVVDRDADHVGSRDQLTSTRFADQPKHGIRNAELHVFDGCAHAALYERRGIQSASAGVSAASRWSGGRLGRFRSPWGNRPQVEAVGSWTLRDWPHRKSPKWTWKWRHFWRNDPVWNAVT